MNIAQGFEKSNYSFTLGNASSRGIVPSTGMERYSARLSAETKLQDNWETGFTGNLVVSELSKQTGANNGIVATVFPAPSSYDLKGIPSHLAIDKYRQNTYRGTAGLDTAYWAVENNEFTENTKRFFGNTYLQYTSRLNSSDKNLTIRYQLGNDTYTTDYSDIWGYGHSNGTGEIDWKSGGSMYAGTATMQDYYGVSQYSADLRNSESFMFTEDAVKITAVDSDGRPTAYAPNDIEIAGSDAYKYLDRINNISESKVLENSFVKLREVALSYPVIEKANIKVSTHLFARNIILWSAIQGFDPEASQGNTNMAGAFERFSLPGTSSYGLGFNMKF